MSWKMLEKIEYHIDQKVRLQKKKPKIENRTEKTRSATKPHCFFSHLTNLRDIIFTLYVLAIISVLQLF